MKDIAKDLGVSVMTVSKALRNHTDISEQTRNRVLKRASQLGYQPNLIARSLVTRRTYVVGLVIPDLMHSFFAEVAKGVARNFDALGYQIVISNSDESAEVEQRQIEVLLARSVDGLMIASSQAGDRARLFETMRKRKVPYVLVDRVIPGVDGHYVGVRDADIGMTATDHLVEQGCLRIAHIRGPEISTGRGRLDGYRRALKKRGINAGASYVVPGHHDDAGGYDAMQKLLRLKHPPDGVFCYNDPVAAGAIKAIIEAGLNVPADVAVIGAGNVHYSDLLRVPLSTVDQSSLLIGETAARLLARCMQSRTPVPVERIFLPPRLVVRESSRRR